MPMFIIQGLLNTPSLVLYGSKNRLKTCERFALLDPRISMRGARLTALLPVYRMRRLKYFCLKHFSPRQICFRYYYFDKSQRSATLV